MNNIKTFLRTLLFYIGFCIAIIVGLVPCYFLSFIPKDKRHDNSWYYFFMNLFYNICLKSLLVPITIKGEKNITNNPSIVVANHQSAIDVLLVGSLVKQYPHIWLFKSELLKIPFYGGMIQRMGVPVDRKNSATAFASLKKTLRLVQGKSRHVIIFPEGERRKDGKIFNFLAGFALIARATQRPVVPILIMNAYQVYPAGSFWVHSSPISVIIGEPLLIQHTETDEEFVNRVRGWFLKEAESL